jgi:hypothetical protein
VIAMIEAPFEAASVALTRGPDRPPTSGTATGPRAVGVPAIARDTDREEAVAEATGLLAKGRVHDVGAAAHTDWTRRPNRGTRETTGSVRRSIEAVTEGLEVSAPGPHLIRRSAQRTRPPPARSSAPRRRPTTDGWEFHGLTSGHEGALGGIHH